MRFHKLGETDISVSTVAMGCWAIVGDSTWGKQDETDTFAAIDAALEAGINFFDTAEAYGNGYSEELLGKAFNGRRKNVVIATKVGSQNLSAEKLKEACVASLERLKTDYIDLYQIHWPNWEAPFAETARAFEDLKKAGKVRAIGACNFGPADLSDFCGQIRCETNQLAYSLLFRAVEFALKEQCVKNNTGILCYSPLMQGLLTGKFRSAGEISEGRARTRHFSSKLRKQTRHGEPGCEAETFAAIESIRKISNAAGIPMADMSLAWLLHQEGVAAVLAGMRNARQARENARAADISLSCDTIKALSLATEEVKQKLGPNLDLWQVEPRMR